MSRFLESTLARNDEAEQPRHLESGATGTEIELDFVSPLGLLDSISTGQTHLEFVDLLGLTDDAGGPMQAIITCFVDGPALRRVVTGPSIGVRRLTGPSNEPVEGLAGPSLSRTPDGPAMITRMTAGPAIQARSVTGPELSGDVTGPAVEEKYVLTGPGKCD